MSLGETVVPKESHLNPFSLEFIQHPQPPNPSTAMQS